MPNGPAVNPAAEVLRQPIQPSRSGVLSGRWFLQAFESDGFEVAGHLRNEAARMPGSLARIALQQV